MLKGNNHHIDRKSRDICVSRYEVVRVSTGHLQQLRSHACSLSITQRSALTSLNPSSRIPQLERSSIRLNSIRNPRRPLSSIRFCTFPVSSSEGAQEGKSLTRLRGWYPGSHKTRSMRPRVDLYKDTGIRRHYEYDRIHRQSYCC